MDAGSAAHGAAPAITDQPTTPLQKARRRVELHRAKKLLEDDLDAIKAEIAKLDEELLAAIEAGTFQPSSKVDGATVYHHQQVWAGPSQGHDKLADALRAAGLTEYLPRTVNSTSLSAYVRERIADTDPTLPLDERVRQAIPELADVLNVTERQSIRVKGA